MDPAFFPSARDAVFIAGVALVAIGLWLWSIPLALVAVGGLLVAISVWGQLRA